MSKSILRVALAYTLAPAALALTGCASLSESMSSQAKGPTQSDVYVYAVDRAAERQGIRVIWVNPPKGGEAARLGYSLEVKDGEEDSNR